MKNILSSESVSHIKKLRKTYPWWFVHKESDIFRTYNEAILVCKKDTTEGLFFVITAAKEKIPMQKWDMFIYGDTKDTVYMESPDEAVYYGVEG